MARFVEISDERAVRDVQLVCCPEFQGFATTTRDWAKQNFYPKNGVVGQVMGEAQSREGLVYLVQVSDSIVVAVRPNGLRDISFTAANRRYPLNMSVGRVSAAEAQQRQSQAMMDDMERMLKGFGL